MTLALYMDVHVDRAITAGLQQRGVDVLTAQEDGFRTAPDEVLLERATELGRVIFTRDRDFLAEAKRRQEEGISFIGVIYAHQLRSTVGRLVNDLELLAKITEPEEMVDLVQFLPL